MKPSAGKKGSRMGMWNPLSRGPLFALLTAIQVEFPASFNCSIINVGKDSTNLRRRLRHSIQTAVDEFEIEWSRIRPGGPSSAICRNCQQRLRNSIGHLRLLHSQMWRALKCSSSGRLNSGENMQTISKQLFWIENKASLIVGTILRRRGWEDLSLRLLSSLKNNSLLKT